MHTKDKNSTGTDEKVTI